VSALVRAVAAALAAAMVLAPAATARAAPVQGFVRAEGNRLVLDGRRYVAKGVMPRLLDLSGKTAFYDNDGGGEVLAPYRFWRDFDTAKAEVEAAFKFYRCTLGANTVRLLTPNPSTLRADITHHAMQPWFLADGAINPVYRDRLVALLDLAARRGIRVQLVLIADVKATEWECQDLLGAWGPCRATQREHGVAAAAAQAKERGAATVRFIRPGTPRDEFFKTYLRSLVPALRDHPAVFAYEIGNENLLNWQLNGARASGNEWFQNQVGSFLRRTVMELRALDKNHLIGTGEVGYYPSDVKWAPLAGEFGRLEDIDKLNDSRPYTLEEVVDFVGAHLYSYISGDLAQTERLVRKVAARTRKPLVPGELNYYDDYRNADLRAMPTPNARRKAFYEMAAKLVDEGVLSGLILFDPIPSIAAAPDAWKPAEPTINGTPTKALAVGSRMLLNMDTRSWIFGYDASQPFKLVPFPEAKFFAELWKDEKETAEFCAQ
jgi:hypothetical protein